MDWVGYIIGIVSIIIAIVIYIMSKSKAIPIVKVVSEIVIDKEKNIKVDDLEILFRGKKIDKLVKTHIFLWNKGNKTIDGNDISQNDIIRIETDDDILRARIIGYSRSVNDFNIQLLNENTISLSFDFIDPKDGVAIEILHVRNIEPKILGTIKGIPDGIRHQGNSFNIFNRLSIGKGTLGFILSSTGTVLAFSLIWRFLPGNSTKPIHFVPLVCAVIVTLIPIVLLSYLLITDSRQSKLERQLRNIGSIDRKKHI